MSGSPPPFRVLHVCTGNICRSPMAERIMRAELGAALGGAAEQVEVRSAGTYGGHEGQPMNPPAAAVLRELGYDSEEFAATWLREEQVGWADLVLTATREHRSAVLHLGPQARRRTFTVRELARLVDGVGPDALPPGPLPARFSALTELAAVRRPLFPPASPAADDLDDPYGCPLDTFRGTAAVLQTAVRAVVAPLAP